MTAPTPPVAATTATDAPPPNAAPPAAADQGDEGKAVDPAAPPAKADADEPLGAGGVKALQAERDRAKAAEAELRTLRADTAKVSASANLAVAKQALFAEAKGRLADPSDAAAFIELADFKVGDDFTVDATQVAAAVDSLLSRKPHLAVKAPAMGDPAPVVPAGGIDQGFREKDAPSLQDQIAAAEKAGDFAKAMALKSNQLFAALTARPT